MDIADVKKNLNKIVLYANRDMQSSPYVFTGCILRREKNNFYYQAELKDTKANSILIVELEAIRALEE